MLDFVRPNVPLTQTETGEHLEAAMYRLPQVVHLTHFEECGLKYGKQTAKRYDLDGHPANARAASIRRLALQDRIGRSAPTSLMHCKNHVQNIVDVQVTAATDKQVVGAMNVGASFLPWVATSFD